MAAQVGSDSLSDFISYLRHGEGRARNSDGFVCLH